MTATYVGNSVVSVVPGTDNISTYCNYSAREEMLAVFEFSESSGSASQDPTMVMNSIYILPLIAMQSVFDDPSVVDGDYTEPILTETTEILSTETITVTINPTSVETLTINIGSIPIVYTFVNLPTELKTKSDWRHHHHSGEHSIGAKCY